MMLHSAEPVTPSPSATLILTRDPGSGLQVYLLRRSRASGFMPGAWVFPGGNLEADDRDVDFWGRQSDMPVERLPGLLGGPPTQMLPFAVAAIRETWEEAGLLLAEPRAAGTCPDPAARHGRLFSRQVRAQGLRLKLSRLAPWHHWITPELSPRRFDTYFFTAIVDADQSCTPDHHEVVEGIWTTPRQALTENHRGRLPLSAPTLVTLHQLLRFADLDRLTAELRNRSWPEAIMPRMWPLKNGFLIIAPWDPDYASTGVAVAEDRLERAVLPVGSPFSRLWCHRGTCLPITA